MVKGHSRASRREQTMRTRRATLTSDYELDRPTQTLNRLYAQGSEEEKQFVGMLNSDLIRVSSFYNGKWPGYLSFSKQKKVS